MDAQLNTFRRSVQLDPSPAVDLFLDAQAVSNAYRKGGNVDINEIMAAVHKLTTTVLTLENCFALQSKVSA